MTCAEKIYREALEQLASEGNEKAKFALSLGVKFERPDSSGVAHRLTNASFYLSKALRANNVWSEATDRHIESAQVEVTAALASLKG